MAKRGSWKREVQHSIVSVLIVFAICVAMFAGYWGARKLLRDGLLGGRRGVAPNQKAVPAGSGGGCGCSSLG